MRRIARRSVWVVACAALAWAVLAALVPDGTAAAQGLWLPPDLNGNNPLVVVAIGDSITEGVLGDGTGRIADRPYPAALQGLLQARYPGVVVVNAGRGGETTAGGLDRLDEVLAQHRPAIVLIMEGTNDATFRTDPGEIVANLRAMVQLARARSTIPVLGRIVPNFRPDFEARDRIDAVNGALPGVAAAEGVLFADTFGAMNDPGLFGPEDILHPNQAGYDALGAAWLGATSAALDLARTLVGGVTVAGARVGGLPAVVAGAGPGRAAEARIFRLDGAALGGTLAAFPGFLGGVRVAACDLDGDLIDDVILGAGPGGGPLVLALKLDAAGTPVAGLAAFFAYDPALGGGVTVACGDLDGDGVPEIVVGAGRGGGPHVRAFRYAPGAPGGVVDAGVSFFPYDAGFHGGIFVAVGNLDGDGPPGHAEIIVGAGPGGGPHVRTFRYAGGAPGGVQDFGVSFFPYDPGFTGGVHVAAGDLDGDGRAELIIGPGAGGGPHVRVFRAAGGVPTEVAGFFAYDPSFRGGVFVGAAGGQVLTGAGPSGGAHVRGFTMSGTPTSLSVIAY